MHLKTLPSFLQCPTRAWEFRNLQRLQAGIQLHGTRPASHLPANRAGVPGHKCLSWTTFRSRLMQMVQMVGERRHGCTPGNKCQKGHCRRPLVTRGSTGVLSILTANHCTCLKPCHVCLICIGLDLGSGPRRRRHVYTGNTYMGSGPKAHIQQLVPMCWESLVALVCTGRSCGDAQGHMSILKAPTI